MLSGLFSWEFMMKPFGLKIASALPFFLFLVSPVLAQPEVKDLKKDKIEFAVDKDAPFLSYKITGGRRSALATDTGKPRLQIWPSGKLVCGGIGVGTEEFETELTEKEVAEILTELVEDRKAYDLSAESIKKEITKLEKQVYIQNATTSKIEINLKQGKHVLEIYASDFTLQQIPKLKEMKRAKEIEHFLEKVIAEAMIGGGRQEKSALKEVNKALKEQYAKKYDPFDFNDIKFATRLKGGKTQLTFERIVEDKKTKSSARLTGRYLIDADGKESASVSLWGIPKIR